jgi:hypothetical protein
VSYRARAVVWIWQIRMEKALHSSDEIGHLEVTREFLVRALMWILLIKIHGQFCI